jgi:hypothetical protein
MEIKGTYKLSYTFDREPKDLILIIGLKMIDGLMKPGQNVWEGIATLDGQPYTKEDLRWCVNARLAAERIGKQMKLKLKEDAQKAGHNFRVKKEVIK